MIAQTTPGSAPVVQAYMTGDASSSFDSPNAGVFTI